MIGPSQQPLELPRGGFRPPSHQLVGEESAPATQEPPAPGPSVDELPAASVPTRASSATSSRGDRSAIARNMATAVSGALVCAYGLVWWLTRRRDGSGLREPTDDDYDAVSEPIGRIVARHVPVELAPAVVQSIADGSQAAGGVTRYLKRGPLLERPPQSTSTPEEGS